MRRIDCLRAASTPASAGAACPGSLCGSTFVADVYLRGDDPIWDDHLIRLSHGCVKAARGCPEFSLQRSVSRSTLDEDGDTIIEIFGVKLLEIADRDEVYARVELRPFQAVGDAANSNVVTGQWGSAGGD